LIITNILHTDVPLLEDLKLGEENIFIFCRPDLTSLLQTPKTKPYGQRASKERVSFAYHLLV
jgi:hypothetical protein